MEYKMKIITHEQLEEINQLANAGHKEALWAYGLECANAVKEGYGYGVKKSIMRGVAYGTVLGVLAFGGYKLGKFVKDKYQEKKNDKETETKN